MNISVPPEEAHNHETAALPDLGDPSRYPLTTEAGESPPRVPQSPDSFKVLKTFLRDQEVAYLNRALEQSGGDKEKAALLLGISLATLYRKLAGEGES